MSSAPSPDESLSEADLHPDPVEQFRRWLEEAGAAGIVFPEAMTLATADADGRPSARTVLLRGLDARGFAFFTNHESRKGRQLAANPHAALVFLWRELERQVCVTGRVERVPAEESEAYFATRPREARLGAWASRQSETVGSRAELEERYAQVEARFADRDVPLPPHWGGFRLDPETVEFWKGRRHRLHDRLRYVRTTDGGWRIERLFP